MRLFPLLLMFFLLLVPTASALPHDSYPSFAHPQSRAVLGSFNNSINVSDTIIYNTAYYNLPDSNNWVPFSLGDNFYSNSDSWLDGAGFSDSLPRFPANNESYILYYSCTLIGNQDSDPASNWDCHGNEDYPAGFWQLIVINTQDLSREELLLLVKDGLPLVDIVVAADAPPMVSLAAQYFQDDIQLMTGATLTINNDPDPLYDSHVYIGQSQYTDALGVTCQTCRDGGFRIFSTIDSLVLLGDDEQFVDLTLPDDEFDALTDPDHWTNDYTGLRTYQKNYDLWQQDGRGSMNAVHELLYRQGMRWYYPSDIGTITPSKHSITIQATDETINPDFAMRAPYISYKKFAYLISGHYPQGSQYGYWEDHLRWILSLGINDEGEYVAGWAHGLNRVTEQPQTVAEHPEYYAIWGGNLMNGLDGNDMKQDLCSEELLQATIRYVKDQIDIYNHSVVGIWPADGFARVSESSQECLDMATPERGKDGAISDYVWEFMNNVAWAIHDDPAYGPDKMIQCGAYPSYQLPPLKLSDPRGFAPNIVVVLTKHRTQTADPVVRQHYQDLTQEWLDLLPSKTVYTWDYYLHNHAVRSNIADYPAFFPHLIDEDLKFLKDKTSGEFIEVYSNWPLEGIDWDSFAANALNTYITTRLYWDADQDVDVLLDEYYELYYGPAKDEMKALVEYAEENLPRASTDPFLLVNMRAMAQEALAIAQADSDPVYAKRVNILLGLINAYYEGDEILIDSCQDLTSPSTTYKLTSDVAAQDSCFLLDGDGITLDCQGHTITYSTGGVRDDDHAIIVNEGRPTNTYRGDYFTIKNCTIQDGSYLSGNTTGSAIYLNGADHGSILDTRINTSGYGITGLGVNITCRRNEVHTYQGMGYVTQYGDRNNLGPASYNLFEHNYFGSVEHYGAQFYQNKNDTLINNTFYSKNSVGIHHYNVRNMTYINNTFISESTVGFRTYGSSTFTVFEGNVQIDG